MKKCCICNKRFTIETSVTLENGEKKKVLGCRHCGFHWYYVDEIVPQDLISQTLASKLCGVSPNAIQQRLRRGTLKGYKSDASSYLLVSRAAVERVAEEMKHKEK